MRGVLCLEDGFYLEGDMEGYEGEALGEVVFFTGMTGYEDAITDPSYAGQILVFSFPLVGNYGIPPASGQSEKVWVRGIVAKDMWLGYSRCGWSSLNSYLKNNKCTILTGVDTRKLVLHLRDQGVKKGIICPVDSQIRYESLATVLESLRQRASTFHMRNVVKEVCVKEIRFFRTPQPVRGTCVVMDFGSKRGIVRKLLDMGFCVYVVPPDYPPQEISGLKPDFVFLSNGPGDPEDNIDAIRTVQILLGRVPVYGICLGHQILAKACGAKIVKLKYGHHGANHPVKDLTSGKVLVTSQNHNFAVSDSELPQNVIVTHRNLNDGTVEGIRIKNLAALSVQYHPGGGPGPRDDGFWKLIAANRHEC